MKLHEAIQTLLRESRSETEATQITDELNRRGLCKRRDGSPIEASQVSDRAQHHPSIFTVQGTLVGLVDWGSTEAAPARRAKARRPAQPAEPIDFDVSSDIGSKAFLEKNGFRFLGQLGELLDGGLPREGWLGCCGLYAITVPAEYKPRYIAPEKARERHNVLHPRSVQELKQKWIGNADVVYYGKASGRVKPRSLRRRLMDLLKHGRGKTTDPGPDTTGGPHKDGETIWQLQGYESFMLWALPTGDAPQPRQLEATLLSRFRSERGHSPFANRQA
ncbi:MAG: hypothetical protein ACYCW6_20235 [Candidatus Xenobia bacterium]